MSKNIDNTPFGVICFSKISTQRIIPMQEKIIIDDNKTVISITGTNSIAGMRKLFVIDNMRKQGYELNEEILRYENCDGFLSLTCQLVFIKKSTL